MMNLFLTAMLFTMPLFLMKKHSPWDGLHTGLWVSLFFWGRITPFLSLLVFFCSLIFCLIRYRTSKVNIQICGASLSVKRDSLPQFLLFVSALTMFCAMGQVCLSYGQFLGIDENLYLQAKGFGFAASLLGPLWFGFLSDKKGPFPALITLILTAALAVSTTAYSVFSPKLFPYSEAMLWLAISGVFVLLPLFMEHYLGRYTLLRTFPRYLLLLTGLWGTIYYTFTTDNAATEHASAFLIFTFILLLTSALFGFLAWKNRLTVIS